MAEAAVCHVRRTLIDAASWTPAAVSLQNCSRLTAKFAVVEDVKFRTDPANPATEITIEAGTYEFFDWPHTGQRPVAGEVYGYFQSTTSTDYLRQKETT